MNVEEGGSGPAKAARPAPEPVGTALPGVAAVELVDVHLGYDGHDVLSAADLVISAGTVTALIGPNGAGKSTLLHGMAGIRAPNRGQITVFGKPVADARRSVAYVLQSTQVASTVPLSVREVVTIGRYAASGLVRRLDADDRAAVDHALERLDLTDLHRRPLRELSGGQRQRVFVAQGVAQRAEVLLLDEPVSGLDLVSQERIFEVIAEERGAGRAVVVSTHDLAEASNADQLVLLAGRVVATGSPAEVLTEKNLNAAYGGRLVRLPSGIVMLDDASHHH